MKMVENKRQWSQGYNHYYCCKVTKCIYGLDVCYHRHPRFLIRRALPAVKHTSGFDSCFRLQCLLLSSTSTLSFDSKSGRISDFELQGLRLLRCSPSGFDACFGLLCALRLVPSASACWGGAGKACERRGPAPKPGGQTGNLNLQQPACLGRSVVNESCYTLVYLLSC